MSDTISPSSASRRDFLKLTGLGIFGLPAAGVASHDGTYPAGTQAAPLFDFTKSSGALQPDKVVDSVCQFCNCCCRLKVHVKDGRIIDVLGEPEDPVQAGGMCVKGEMMTQLVYNRFRLTKP
ncbi:MAG: oxidoreductase, partial [Chthoniobacteraceae bacterium]